MNLLCSLKAQTAYYKNLTNRVKKEVSTTMPGVLPRFLINSFIALCPLWLFMRWQQTS